MKALERSFAAAPGGLAVWAVLAVAAATNLAAGEAPGEKQKEASTTGQLSPQEIGEILRIRRALGGSMVSAPNASRGASLALPGAEPQEFHQALQAVKLSPQAPAEKGLAATSRLQGTAVGASAPAGGALRGAARKLDDAAADLEEVGAYATADRLRGIADSLRLQARSLVVAGRPLPPTPE